MKRFFINHLRNQISELGLAITNSLRPQSSGHMVADLSFGRSPILAGGFRRRVKLLYTVIRKA